LHAFPLDLYVSAKILMKERAIEYDAEKNTTRTPLVSTFIFVKLQKTTGVRAMLLSITQL